MEKKALEVFIALQSTGGTVASFWSWSTAPAYSNAAQSYSLQDYELFWK